MKYDILKSGIENILALVNADNAQEFTLEQISIGAPTVFEDETGVNPRNTQIVVSAQPGSGMVGSQTLRYARLDLAGIPVDPIEIHLGETTTLADVKAEVLGQLLVSDSEVEFTVAEIPAFEEGATSQVLTLQAIDGSYGYIGSVGITVLAYEAPAIGLSDVLPNQDLNGFDYFEYIGQ